MKILEILFSKESEGVTRLHHSRICLKRISMNKPQLPSFTEKDDKPSHQTAVVIKYIREMCDFWKFLQTSWNLDDIFLQQTSTGRLAK